jgi:colanic acid/amylovoran biosynthesis glycosyltransferase
MPHPSAPVVYIIGQYPRAAQTFIRQEIAAVEAKGVRVAPVAMNEPSESDLLTADAQHEHARTFYVKAQSKLTIIRALAHALRANPSAFVGALLSALKPAKTDVRAMLWSAFYFVEAMIVWDQCLRIGARRLHSQFAYPGSNVASLVADFGNRVDGAGTWAWLLTIHGAHDFYNQDDVGLARKAVSVEHIICISDFIRAQVLRQLEPALWPKVVVRRCGIDLSVFEQRGPRELATPPLVLTVARLSAEKGHLVLVEAAAKLRDRGIACAVEIVGDGPLRADIERSIASFGLVDVVRLVGELPPQEVSKRLAQADVFCLPSFAEGVPISIMEAMAVGVPVVASGVGGVPELVERGVTGGVVAPGRADLLADELAAMLSDEQRRQRIVTAARQRVEQLHDLRSTVVALLPLVSGSDAVPASTR